MGGHEPRRRDVHGHPAHRVDGLVPLGGDASAHSGRQGTGRTQLNQFGSYNNYVDTQISFNKKKIFVNILRLA